MLDDARADFNQGISPGVYVSLTKDVQSASQRIEAHDDNTCQMGTKPMNIYTES